MVTGVVTSRLEAVIDLVVARSSIEPVSQQWKVPSVLDTGFSGLLTLPTNLVNNMNLSLIGDTVMVLADGSEAKLDVHLVYVF